MQLLDISYSLDTIDVAAGRFWEVAKDFRIITFSGDLGAGKTTFISSLCNHLHVEDAVSSPTFALINQYGFAADGGEDVIFHLDWYRLRDTSEAINAGMEDCLDQARAGAAYCFVEWPEKAQDLLRSPYLAVFISTTGPEDRSMIVNQV
jgi:tRNA threonylcarbamoyladenosine biosynthesis protein TsaE